MSDFVLHLIRHGLSEWNAAGRIQGHSNSDLTELGRAQGRAAGRALARLPLVALYASDLDRAQQTAAAIGETVPLEIQTDPRLRESNFGDFEGMTWPEVEAKHPDAQQQLLDPEFSVPGGESRSETLGRALDAFEDFGSRHTGGHVAAVTHGGLMGFFMRHVVGIPLVGRAPFKTANGNISTFERKNDRWKLVTWGATAHLVDLPTA